MTSGLQIREPDVAGAIGRCVNQRAIGGPTADHPVPCGWEDYPTDVLVEALRDFTAWAEFDDRHNTTGHHALRTFAELPRARQRELVVEAQAFPPEPEPEPAAHIVSNEIAPEPPAPVEEDIPWLTR